MGMQFVVHTTSADSVCAALGSIADEVEIFPITISTIGVSIPTKVLDAVGEKAILGRIASFEHFDLWSGTWMRSEV